MKTLTATRQRNSSNYVTTTFSLEGKVKAVFDSKIRQPRKGLKTITINSKEYLTTDAQDRKRVKELTLIRWNQNIQLWT